MLLFSLKNGEDELEVNLYKEDYDDVLENALVSATILNFEKEELCNKQL